MSDWKVGQKIVLEVVAHGDDILCCAKCFLGGTSKCDQEVFTCIGGMREDKTDTYLKLVEVI